MTLKTRPVRLSLLSLLSAPLAGAKINAQLSLATPGGVVTPAYEIDGVDVVPLVVTLTEDPAKPGDYTGNFWPNTRGLKGTRWLINVAAGELLLKSLNLTVIDGSAAVVVPLSVIVNAAPYPQVFPSGQVVGVAQGYANAAGNSASLAAGAAAEVLAINDRHYGPSASDPPTRPSGAPRQTGDEYFNTTSNLLKRFNGANWQASDINTANLAAPSGVTLLGGTWFGGVVAMVSALATYLGASLIGYMQAGTGAVARSIQSKLRESVSVFDFMTAAEIADVIACTGLLDVGSACDKARDHVLTLGKKGKLLFPAGLYSRETTWDFSWPGLFVVGQGRFNTVLKFTGGGIALRVDDSRPNNGAYTFTHYLADFCVEGTGATQILLYLKNINHANWSNINLREANSATGAAFVINGSVAGCFSNIICSTNAQLMTNRPNVGLAVDRDPTTLSRASDNTFINLIIEGVTGDGIQLVGADQTLFMGGTSENNDGNGVTITAGSRLNTFLSMGFENLLGFADIYDGGFSNRFLNCYTNSKIYIAASSTFSKVEGGYHQTIQDAGSFSTIENLKYNFFRPGGTVSTNSTTSTKNLFDTQANALTFATKPPVVAAVTASPYTYTNGSGLDEDVIVSGGAVTQIVFHRGGPVITLPVAGMYRLAPTDKLVISYTVAPTVVRIPHGVNYI